MYYKLTDLTPKIALLNLPDVIFVLNEKQSQFWLFAINHIMLILKFLMLFLFYFDLNLPFELKPSLGPRVPWYLFICDPYHSGHYTGLFFKIGHY